MRETDFKRWLESQNYRPNTISTQLQHARKIEGAYGDLDELYVKDGFDSLIADLTYSAADKVANRPNPSKVQLWGNTYRDLTSLRASVRYYQRFRQGVKRIREGLQSPEKNAVERAMDECDRIGVLTFMDSYGSVGVTLNITRCGMIRPIPQRQFSPSRTSTCPQASRSTTNVATATRPISDSRHSASRYPSIQQFSWLERMGEATSRFSKKTDKQVKKHFVASVREPPTGLKMLLKLRTLSIWLELYSSRSVQCALRPLTGGPLIT